MKVVTRWLLSTDDNDAVTGDFGGGRKILKMQSTMLLEPSVVPDESSLSPVDSEVVAVEVVVVVVVVDVVVVDDGSLVSIFSTISVVMLTLLSVRVASCCKEIHSS